MWPRWRTLFGLLHEFPACLAVWLARKAGEAYEAGAFWEKFGTLIGVTIPAAGLGVAGAWWAMVTDVILRSLLAAGRFALGGWKRIRV